MLTNPTEIGFIYANIAGDYRYSTKIRVMVEGNQCEVEIHHNSAVGGMDGPGGAYPYRLSSMVACPANPKDILKTLKKVINSSDADIIKRYGKPSKRFSWVGSNPGRGLNVSLVKAALDWHAQK